jgi:hypothetical protein
VRGRKVCAVDEGGSPGAWRARAQLLWHRALSSRPAEDQEVDVDPLEYYEVGARGCRLSRARAICQAGFGVNPPLLACCAGVRAGHPAGGARERRRQLLLRAGGWGAGQRRPDLHCRVLQLHCVTGKI